MSSFILAFCLGCIVLCAGGSGVIMLAAAVFLTATLVVARREWDAEAVDARVPFDVRLVNHDDGDHPEFENHDNHEFIPAKPVVHFPESVTLND